MQRPRATLGANRSKCGAAALATRRFRSCGPQFGKCINCFSIAVIKHHDQKQLVEEFIWVMVLEG